MSRFILLGTGGLLSSICLKHIIAHNFLPDCVLIQKNDHSAYPNLTQIVCDNHGIKYYLIDKANSDESLEIIKNINPDFAIIASFGEIIKAPLINLFPIYNVHMGILPDYRGAYTNFWKIMNNDDVYGVTIHRISEEIDGGKICLTVEQDFSGIIFAGDFFNRNYEMAASLLLTFLTQLNEGSINEVAIDTSKGKYYRKHTQEDMVLNPEEDVSALHKKINRLQFYGKPSLGGNLLSGSHLMLEYEPCSESFEIISASAGKRILKNRSGVLLLNL